MESPDSHPDLLINGDPVQETLLRAIDGLGSIEVRGPGVFQASVRQVGLHRIRGQVPITPSPHFRSLHADPRGCAFLERMGLEHDR